LYEDERFEDALHYYTRAQNFNEEDYHTHNNIADCLISLDRVNEAQQQIEKVLKLRADFAPAHCTQAELYMKQGKIDLAIDSFNEVINLTGKIRQDSDKNMLYRYASEMVESLSQRA